jgi:hypothetical protein
MRRLADVAHTVWNRCSIAAQGDDFRRRIERQQRRHQTGEVAPDAGCG